MAAAIALAYSLALSGLFALLVVRFPSIGVGRDPHTSLVAALVGAVVATAALLILIGAPAVFGMAWRDWWPFIVSNYFLAMGHQLIAGPYAFNWTPLWIYPVGSLTPLIALGASVALAAGLVSHRRSRRAAGILVVYACCLLAAYVAAGIYTAWGTWWGVAV
jgi:hypothetical protein